MYNKTGSGKSLKGENPSGSSGASIDLKSLLSTKFNNIYDIIWKFFIT